MANSFKNSKTEIVFAALATAALLERATRGIFLAEASSFVRGNGTPRQFTGETAIWMGLLYLGLSLLPIGFLLRFNRWKALLYLGLFVLWVTTCSIVLLS